MIQLGSCPFCGGQAAYSRIPGQGFSILCKDCGALAVHGKYKERDQLGTAWNQRQTRHNFNDTGKVKPCPFCASRAGVGKLAGSETVLACERCGLMVSFLGGDDLNSTISLWNRRV